MLTRAGYQFRNSIGLSHYYTMFYIYDKHRVNFGHVLIIIITLVFYIWRLFSSNNYSTPWVDRPMGRQAGRDLVMEGPRRAHFKSNARSWSNYWVLYTATLRSNIYSLVFRVSLLSQAIHLVREDPEKKNLLKIHSLQRARSLASMLYFPRKMERIICYAGYRFLEP